MVQEGGGSGGSEKKIRRIGIYNLENANARDDKNLFYFQR